MAIVSKITTNSLTSFYVKQITPVIGQIVNEMYQNIQSFSPVRTGQFRSQNRNLGVRNESGNVVGEVENIGLYSERVEIGFRKTVVNWHRNNGQIYRNRGSDTYKIALLRAKESLIKKLG